jgi:hypothetical protein
MIIEVPSVVLLAVTTDPVYLTVSVDQGRCGGQDGKDEGEGSSLTEHRECVFVELI